MKDKKKKGLKKLLSVKSISLLLMVILSIAFFAFDGARLLQSAFIESNKTLDANEEIEGKEIKPNVGESSE